MSSEISFAPAPARGSPAPIPLFVLAGAQGSGKTAAINRWLRLPGFARTLVVLQQDGASSLGHHLVAHCADGILRRGFGCVCCGPQADLPRTLRDLPWRFAREGQRLFDRVLIEAAGDADPQSVAGVLQAYPRLARQYRLAGVACVLGQPALEALDEPDTMIWRQAAASGLLLLPRLADIGAARYATLMTRLKALPAADKREMLPADAEMREPALHAFFELETPLDRSFA
ncbi:MAG: hypothetical protein M0R28_19475 [Pigmentiphaga sp.]|nr:hypothetical protein [Pigmentiphaga sp.]